MKWSNLIRVGTLATLIRSTVVPPFSPLFSCLVGRERERESVDKWKSARHALAREREFYLILPLTGGWNFPFF